MLLPRPTGCSCTVQQLIAAPKLEQRLYQMAISRGGLLLRSRRVFGVFMHQCAFSQGGLLQVSRGSCVLC